MDAQRGSHRPTGPVDGIFATVVAGLELSDVLLFNPDGHRGAVTLLLVAFSALPLVGWRRWPFVALQLTGAATIVLAARHAPHLGLGPIACTYAVACWGGRRNRIVAGAMLLVGVWLVPVLTADAATVPTNAALYAAAWILGTLMRQRTSTLAVLKARTQQLASERQENAALAAEMERARIARELHDVLTHSVSVMVIQAQAAQAAGPEHASAALERIVTIGQESLAELRALLRRVRPDGELGSREPQPGLQRLDRLVSEVRSGGLEVSVAREGTAGALPATVELSAYRIVQEALTNTIRHSTSASASIRLSYLPDELALEISDDGPAHSPRAPAAGRGIAGMRERATMLGGTFHAQPLPDGGFCVTARLPVPRAR